MGQERKVTVRPRGNRIQFIFSWMGKQRFESLPLPVNGRGMKSAEALANRMDKDLLNGTFSYADYFPDSPRAKQAVGGRPKNFFQLSMRWLNQLEVSPATLKKYRCTIESRWMRKWKDRDYRSLHFTEIQEAIASIQWSSEKARNDALTPLRCMFRYARKAGWLTEDPMEMIEFKKNQDKRPDPLTPEEAWLVINDIKENKSEQWGLYFQFCFFTGMRPSEVFALVRDDLDREHNTIKVNKAMTELGKAKTKTHRERDVELNEFALEAIEGSLALPDAGESEFLFRAPRSGGQIMTGSSPRKVWEAALKRLKIRHRPAYVTRATYITMQIMAGVNIYWLATQCGNSVQVIQTNYAKWLRQADRNKESSKLGEYLKQVVA